MRPVGQASTVVPIQVRLPDRVSAWHGIVVPPCTQAMSLFLLKRTRGHAATAITLPQPCVPSHATCLLLVFNKQLGRTRDGQPGITSFRRVPVMSERSSRSATLLRLILPAGMSEHLGTEPMHSTGQRSI